MTSREPTVTEMLNAARAAIENNDLPAALKWLETAVEKFQIVRCELQATQDCL